MLTKSSNIIPPLEHKKNHIFLTLNNNQIRGYIANLLELDTPIILYSYQHNIDYSYVDKQIFDPYSVDRISLHKNDMVLYKLYPDCFDNLIIWCMESKYSNYPEIGQVGIVNWNIGYEEKIFNAIKKVNIDFKITSHTNNNFRTEISETEMKKIIKTLLEYSKSTNYKITLNYYTTDNNNIYMTGNNLTYYKNPDTLLLVNEFNQIGIVITNSNIIIRDKNLTNEIYPIMIEHDFQRIKSDITHKIELKNSINSALKIDLNINFLFVETATNNIILTPDKKNSILIARNRITIKMRNYYKGLEKYLVLMVISYNYIHSPNYLSNPFLSWKPYYWSRICQNANNKNRKPTLFIPDKSYFQENNIKEIGPNFFRGKNIDLYIDESNNVHKCSEDNGQYVYLGFLKIFHNINNTCLPCCFIQDQTKTQLYKKCIEKKEYEQKEVDLYILKYGKIILENKISFLKDSINNFLNKGVELILEEENRRIIKVNNFTVITGLSSDKSIRLAKEQDILNYVNGSKIILIQNDNILYPREFYVKPSEFYDYKVLIKEMVHNLIEIKKDNKTDMIKKSVNLEKRKMIYELNHFVPDDKTITKKDGLELKFGGFYVDGELFETRLSTDYTISIKNINVDEKQTNVRVVKKYFTEYFKNIECSQPESFIKAFIINIFLLFNLKNSIDEIEKTKRILQEYFSKF